MRVFGIICEYNPFHRGHKWQIDELRRLAGEEECAVVCAMRAPRPLCTAGQI